jgi:lysyl-tRNA synthetase class 2
MSFQIDKIRVEKLKKAKEISFRFPKETFEDVTAVSKLFDLEDKSKITISGRITEIRKNGKIYFLDIKIDGIVQAFIQQTDKSNVFEEFKELIDKGDYIRIYGSVDATNKIEIQNFILLAKSLFILPKVLNNTYLKNNFRYIDALIDSQVSIAINNQAKILKAVRIELWDNDFSEFSTPILSTQYNGGAATPFETTIRSLNKKGFLRVSSDIQLKMLIASGQKKIFELGNQFRNEGLDSKHLPEFLMLEAYQTETEANSMLQVALKIFERIATAINGEAVYFHNGEKINCKITDWKYINAREEILKLANIDILNSEEELKNKVRNAGLIIEDNASFATIINKLIENYILNNATYPTIVEGLPYGMTPLIKKGANEFAQRYWLFASQIDFCDIGHEENDYFTQVDALNKQYENQLQKKQHTQVNEEIKSVIAFGIPPLSGIGMSLSRVAMIFASSKDIRESSAFCFK